MQDPNFNEIFSGGKNRTHRAKIEMLFLSFEKSTNNQNQNEFSNYRFPTIDRKASLGEQSQIDSRLGKCRKTFCILRQGKSGKS